MIFFQAFYFFLPAYAANMAPVIAAALGLPGGAPLSQKHLGANKTLRGFYAGFVGAFFLLVLQQAFQDSGYFEPVRLLDYSSISIPLFAFLFGVGAIAGDTFKSFFKRRMGIASGSPWVPFDQVDFILGSTILLSFAIEVPLQIFIVGLLITPVLHLGTNVVAYWLGLKKVWW